MPHFVKIQMASAQGWWTTSENATLVDPDRYAMKVYAQTPWCLGVRITDHDTGEVWKSGPGNVPDTILGVGHPSDPDSRDVKAKWDDLLGDPKAETAASSSWDDLL